MIHIFLGTYIFYSAQKNASLAYVYTLDAMICYVYFSKKNLESISQLMSIITIQ